MHCHIKAYYASNVQCKLNNYVISTWKPVRCIVNNYGITLSANLWNYENYETLHGNYMVSKCCYNWTFDFQSVNENAFSLNDFCKEFDCFCGIIHVLDSIQSGFLYIFANQIPWLFYIAQFLWQIFDHTLSFWGYIAGLNVPGVTLALYNYHLGLK